MPAIHKAPRVTGKTDAARHGEKTSIPPAWNIVSLTVHPPQGTRLSISFTNVCLSEKMYKAKGFALGINSSKFTDTKVE
ncbi:hypothetical protein E2C01_030400 [Portunus trituberculatus]|uniref:Uncharacterized protein n=1 Tax=Portunus trituberculatus TaxID=210409 RepID=A0A5B7EQR5_PORTR|nr:hypothetical protein [Portunus trituberculatus]